MTEKIWITSDTHFFHHNIIKYEQRPYKDIDEMNQELIKNWNELVAPDDLVYFLGDFGIGKAEDLRQILISLNGKISIVRGNHDDSISKMLEIGFASIADQLHLKYMGIMCFFTHVPQQPSQLDEVINIHGHIHGKQKFGERTINVSTDAWEYRPIELKELVKQYRKNKKKK